MLLLILVGDDKEFATLLSVGFFFYLVPCIIGFLPHLLFL